MADQVNLEPAVILASKVNVSLDCLAKKVKKETQTIVKEPRLLLKPLVRKVRPANVVILEIKANPACP